MADTNTNVASLVNSSTLNTIKNSKNISTFGDQLTNKNQQTIISGNAATLKQLLRTKESLIQEEIDLNLKHQQKLLQLQGIASLPLLTDNLPFPPTEYSEATLQKYDEDYINYYNKRFNEEGFWDDGLDGYLHYKIDKIPFLKSTIKVWLVEEKEIGLKDEYDISSYPTAESVYMSLGTKKKKRVDEGKVTIKLSEVVEELPDVEKTEAWKTFIMHYLIPRNAHTNKIHTITNMGRTHN